MRPRGPADAAVGPRVRRNHLIAFAGALVFLAALVVGAAAIRAALSTKNAVVSECRVTVGSSQYIIDPHQAENATTITAVGKRLGMADHAVTIALAAALQESKLHNLPYGDRDSLGLFQQRPSQGWGTPAQVMNPRHAAAAFFTALARVPDWQASSVTSAAQAVQHSNAPQAYARWERLARTLAIATTGEAPAALSCQFALARSTTSTTSPIPAMTQDLGPVTLGTPVPPTRGWTIASWLVGHAEQYRITAIRFGGREWTPHGRWSAIHTTQSGVRITQTPAAPR